MSDAADPHLSHEITSALNASMPDAVSAASRARLASTMILVGAVGVVPLGILAVILTATLSTSPGLAVGIATAFVLLIAVELTGLVLGLRAKRAVQRIGETVERLHQATLVRVVDRQVHVRR